MSLRYSGSDTCAARPPGTGLLPALVAVSTAFPVARPCPQPALLAGRLICPTTRDPTRRAS